MAQGGGLPGIAVGMAAAGSLLIYAGFQGTDPLNALKQIATGKPAGLAGKAAAREALYEGVGVGGSGTGGGGVAQASLSGAAISGPHPEFVAAAERFAGDTYSQSRRWQAGYSDCSSFVGKALKACGITPPGASTTSSYLVWRKAKPVPKSSIGAGDFLVSSGHMAIAINSTTAIGQQRKGVNVKVAPISQIMWGQSWVALRYTGPSSGGVAST